MRSILKIFLKLIIGRWTYEYKKDYFIDRVSSVDIDNLTPIEALSLLNNLVQDANNLKEG